jgi:large subunit ribosomal protein L5
MKEKYESTAVPKLREQFGIKNPMALPRLEKIVITVGLGKELVGTKLNATAKEQVLANLNIIAGQRPVVTKAKKAISNFKVRRGYENGAMVTLRGQHMWEFFDRLVCLAIPRIRDFRGLKTTSFDGQGNYTMGVTEQAIFPEINMAEAKYNHGMNITFVINNSDPDRSRLMLAELGMPFVRPDEQS